MINLGDAPLQKECTNDKPVQLSLVPGGRFDKSNRIEKLKNVLPPIWDSVSDAKYKTVDEKASPCPKCGEGEDRFIINDGGNKFWCRVCEWQGDKIDFYKESHGVDLNGLFSIYLDQPKKEKARPTPENLKQTYTYQNNDGQDVIRVNRYEEPGKEKTFLQFHFDGEKWVNGTKGIKKYLYRLTEVINSKYVIVVEGEKDVDRLRDFGIVATTNIGGSSAWTDEYSECLKGKHIAIIPDNDSPGRKWAGNVAKSCQGKAESIRIVGLQGLPVKGDVSTWFDAGGTDKQLTQLIQDTEAWTPGPVAKEQSRGFQLVHISKIESRLPDWLIRSVLEHDTLSLIFGDPGTCKTFAAIALSACVATGTDFYGNKTVKGWVFYIAGEGQSGIKRRFMAWAIRNKVNIDEAQLLISLMPASLCDSDHAAMVIEAVNSMAEKHGVPALIVFDTVARNFGPGDENSTSDMSKFIQAVDYIRAQHRSAILLVHHTGHSDKSRARGAMALKGALDAEYRFDKDEAGVVRMECTKMKDFTQPQPMAFKLRTVELPEQDEEGQPVTSAVLDLTNYESQADEKISAMAKVLLDLLRLDTIRYTKNELIKAPIGVGVARDLKNNFPAFARYKEMGKLIDWLVKENYLIPEITNPGRNAKEILTVNFDKTFIDDGKSDESK
jgi:hypothetical protein